MDDWMINQLEIENFKSIKHQKIKCKRINVFIGKPNVGKSNILEAVSLLGGYNSEPVLLHPGFDQSTEKSKIFNEYVRYEEFNNLFYDKDRSLNIKIDSNLGYFFSRYHQNSIAQYDLVFGHDEEMLNFFTADRNNYSIASLKEDFTDKYLTITREINSMIAPEWVIKPMYITVGDGGRLTGVAPQKQNSFIGNIKRYEFKKNEKLDNDVSIFLNPPHGNNVFRMLEVFPKLYDEIAGLFEEYGLELVLDSVSNKLKLMIQKKIGRKVYQIPYSLCADTLQRYIFHLLAVKTNNKSVLILEEPESHSFPPYISAIADEIVEDKNNQYFIATHSPYLLSEFIEKCDKDELALFICNYKDYQTTMRELTREEISNIKSEDIDLFYNLPAFQND